MNLFHLLQEDGINARKVSQTNGGEYAGPCPSCGGADRFRAWPEQGDGGKYWCRQCEKGGDAIQYLRDFRGMSFQEACAFLGRDSSEWKPTYSGNTRPGPTWTPKEVTIPCGIWPQRAKKFLAYAEGCLWSKDGSEGQKWLESRGLSEETIKKFRLGWNPVDAWRERKAWGLPEELNKKEKSKKLWFPRGLVIPKIQNGQVHRVRFRRPNPPGGKQRYILLSGSTTDTLVIPGGPSCVVVESELDAILLDQEAGDLLTAVALGSASNRPDKEAVKVLSGAYALLNALDYDPAGAKQAWTWWKDNFPQAKRWPTVVGKDPGEARENGLDLRAWIMAGLDLEESKADEEINTAEHSELFIDLRESIERDGGKLWPNMRRYASRELTREEYEQLERLYRENLQEGEEELKC